MLAASSVVGQPLGVDNQDRVGGMGQCALDGLGRKQNIGIGTDKALLHLVLGVEERGEDVVVLPVSIMPKGELGISLAHLVDLVAANENNVLKAVLLKCL